MKHYIVHMSVGYAGMDAYAALSMPDDATQEEIDLEAWHMALDHAESFGYYPPDCDYDEEDEEEDTWDSDKISNNIEGYPELYNPEKHDGKRSGGGSFQQDFDRYDK